MWPSAMSGDRRNALVAVFRTLSSRWPQRFSAERVAELVPTWAVALEYVRTDVLEPAAVQFCAQWPGTYAPSPPEFSRFAKELQQKTSALPAGGVPVAADLPDVPKKGDRIAALSQWAFERVETWALVAEVWALLMDTAPDAAHRDAVRNGTLSREVFRDAVVAVQNGTRVMRRGPLSATLGAA